MSAPDNDLPLEPSSEVVRALTNQALDYLVAFTDGRADALAADFTDVEPLIARLSGPPPEVGQSFPELLELIADASRKGHDTTGDGWLAYVPGGGLFSAALGDFIGRVTNRFVGVWEPAPAMAQMEATVVGWFRDLFGLPSTARGVLTTGGSLATLSAVITARHHLLGEDIGSGTLYLTSETHSAIVKAAALAGLPLSAVRLVPVTSENRMDVGQLEAMIGDDRAAGRKPFLVVGSAGTTNTGAIDPLPAIADVAQRQGLWFHVDAAYGGFFQLTDRGRALFGGIERANSVVLDPHKGMFLPYGTGALLVRDGAALRAAHEIHGPYLHDLAPESAIPNFADYSAELSRDSRGLRVWLPVMLHGLAAFRRALDEKLDLTVWLESELRSIPALEVPWHAELSTIAFRCRDEGASSGDVRTAELLQQINASGRVFLSSTTVQGRMVIRVCILSVHTHRDRVEELVAIIKRGLADSG
jgi:aromatic-L-amino-acid decarboxylase